LTLADPGWRRRNRGDEQGADIDGSAGGGDDRGGGRIAHRDGLQARRHENEHAFKGKLCKLVKFLVLRQGRFRVTAVEMDGALIVGL